MKVSYVQSQNLYDSVLKSLHLIKDEIKTKPTILIKPNFVSTYVPLCATHVDQVKALVDFFKDKSKKIIIAESPAIGSAKEGFENYNYYSQLEGVEFMDLDEQEQVEVEIFYRSGEKFKIHIPKILTNRDVFVVSAAKLKSHNTVVATLSAKNIIMGAASEKSSVHQGYKFINKNLAEIMKALHIDLAVLDGINAMQGNGPVRGRHINANCVIASTDFLAADRVALEVMGISPEKVGYLNYISELRLGEFDLGKIEIVGDFPLGRHEFKLHDTVEQQYNWK